MRAFCRVSSTPLWSDLRMCFFCQALEGRVKEVAAALQELKTTQVYDKREQERPCDVAFSNEAEGVSHACRDLSQEVKVSLTIIQC